jgi:hypothetical protein
MSVSLGLHKLTYAEWRQARKTGLEDRIFEKFLESEPFVWTVSDLAHALGAPARDVQAAVDSLVERDELV